MSLATATGVMQRLLLCLSYQSRKYFDTSNLNCRQLEVRWLGVDEQRVVGRQHIAAHSSGWRVFKLGSGVLRGQDETGPDTAHVALQVTSMTLTGRPLSLTLHHESRGSRRPLLVLFSSLIINATAEPPAMHRGKYMR